MKTWFVTYNTNYGLAAMVIAARTHEQSLEIAKEKGAWSDVESREIITPMESGVIFHE